MLNGGGEEGKVFIITMPSGDEFGRLRNQNEEGETRPEPRLTPSNAWHQASRTPAVPITPPGPDPSLRTQATWTTNGDVSPLGIRRSHIHHRGRGVHLEKPGGQGNLS